MNILWVNTAARIFAQDLPPAKIRISPAQRSLRQPDRNETGHSRRAPARLLDFA